MAFDIGKAAKQVAYEGRWLLSFAQRVLNMSDTITKSSAKIESQAAEIERLTEAVRVLQVSEKLAIARMEAAVVRAAAVPRRNCLSHGPHRSPHAMRDNRRTSFSKNYLPPPKTRRPYARRGTAPFAIFHGFAVFASK